jgi:hypothetical protein
MAKGQPAHRMALVFAAERIEDARARAEQLERREFKRREHMHDKDRAATADRLTTLATIQNCLEAAAKAIEQHRSTDPN